MAGPRYPDGVSRSAADDRHLQTFDEANRKLASMEVPVLHDGRPDSRMFLAFFDGTGNDAGNPALGKTNVALLHQAAKEAARERGDIGTAYLRGPGTQESRIAKGPDAGFGYSYDERIEAMYVEFCRQAKTWIADNPGVRISLASTGFSRGAEQAAGFARLVAERGVVDIDSARLRSNDEGLVVRADYSRARQLMPGHLIAQAELLFDPVSTGTPHRNDRRPPPQVLTGLQITSLHERRDLFPSTRILDPGFSHDGRFLNVLVPGDHSDNGGSYVEDGLARRTHNIGADFLNGILQPPIFEKRYLRRDLDVVHRSVEHLGIYDDDYYRRNERRGWPEDERRAVVDVINGRPRDRSASARDAEPIDAELDARFQRRKIEIGPLPAAPAEFRDLPPAHRRDDLQPHAPRRSPMHLLLGPFADAESRGDPDARRAALDTYLASPVGQAFTAQVEARAREAREAERERQQAPPVHERHEPRVRSMAM